MSKKLFLYILLILFALLLYCLLGRFLFVPSSDGIAVPAAMTAAERQNLAEACQRAAEQLENGTDVQIVNEFLRTAVALQPGSGDWAADISTIFQTAASPNPQMFAKNLRLISQELKP